MTEDKQEYGQRKAGGGCKKKKGVGNMHIQSRVSASIEARLVLYKQDSERTVQWIVSKALDEYLKTRNY